MFSQFLSSQFDLEWNNKLRVSIISGINNNVEIQPLILLLIALFLLHIFYTVAVQQNIMPMIAFAWSLDVSVIVLSFYVITMISYKASNEIVPLASGCIFLSMRASLL